MTTDFDHAADVARQYDRDRYLSALLAPADHRPGLMALYAFNAEIARTRELVSEPLPGKCACNGGATFCKAPNTGPWRRTRLPTP